MNEYILRLIHCGYPLCEAISTYHDFIKEYSLKDLILFIESLEKEVDNICT
jgi:hypothetical protein